MRPPKAIQLLLFILKAELVVLFSLPKNGKCIRNIHSTLSDYLMYPIRLCIGPPFFYPQKQTKKVGKKTHRKPSPADQLLHTKLSLTTNSSYFEDMTDARALASSDGRLSNTGCN